MKSRLKIVHTESHCQWGGQEMRVFNESRWMSQRGHHIILIAPKHSVIYEKASHEKWEVYHACFNEFGMLKDFFRMRRLLKKIQPDVLNTHGNIDSKVVLAAAAGLGIPCVIRSRHSTPPIRNLWYNRILYRKLSHYVFTSAAFVKKQIVKDLGIPENRVFSLPSGFFVPSDLPEHEEARQALAAELNLNPGTRFIGFVGRLSSEKGLPFLIEAFFKVKDIFPGYHLVLVGKGDMQQRLEQQSRRYGIRDRVHFLGYRDNPWSYFRAYDCFMLVSSKYEAAAQVVQQAMYARCPVIGSDAGGIPDVVVHKETGLLVPPDNAEQLTEAILQTLENPDAAKRRTEKAFRYVCENHTIDVMGERILRLYERHL